MSERGWNKCDDCGKFRNPEQMEYGENPTMDFGAHVSLNEYQICKPGYGCADRPTRRHRMRCNRTHSSNTQNPPNTTKTCLCHRTVT